MKIKFLITYFLLLIVFSACEYEIIDSKLGESVDTVSNLDYSISEGDITLTWDLPSSYPNDIIQPVSIFIRVTKRDKERPSEEYPLYSPATLNAGTFTIDGNPTSFTYTQYDPRYSYRFTIKVMAKVDVNSPNFSDLRYSKGVIIEI